MSLAILEGMAGVPNGMNHVAILVDLRKKQWKDYLFYYLFDH
jgi:hypothetical protein